jgi:hypothetical protein
MISMPSYKRRSRVNLNQFVKRVSLKLNFEVRGRKKMKIILSVGTLFLVLGNLFAEKTIACQVLSWDTRGCVFSGVTIEPNETVSINIYPANVDVSTIQWIQIARSSIYSLPREIFTKFPNLALFSAEDQNIQEIKLDTFADARKLHTIHLSFNKLTYLHSDTFKGK